MFRSLLLKSLFLLILLAPISCSDFKKGMGFEKDRPDEFLVRKTNSIEKPPNYELLPPDSKIKKSVNKNTESSAKNEIDDFFNENKKISESLRNNKETSLENIILKEIEKN